MVNPVSNTKNQLNIPLNSSAKHRDLLQEIGCSSQTHVSLSGKAQQLKLFESDTSVIEELKKEFNEIFELDDENKNSFLKKLDHIFVGNKF